MKKKIVGPLVALFVLACIPAALFAQHDLEMYNMQSVPQRIFQNPAFIPAQKFYIGLPVISGIQSSFANPFSYNDVIERDAYDSVTFRVENFLDKINKHNRMRLYTDLDILSFGTGISDGRFFLGFSIRERLSQHVMIPGDLAGLLWYGNASPRFFGRRVNVAPKTDISAWDEWGVSFSGYALQRKITWGGRLKYLSGRINATTKKSEFTVYTDTATYDLLMQSDFELQTSGIDGIEHYLDQPVSSLVFPGNNGFAFDLGASWQVNSHLDVSAAVLDVGFIRWKTRTMTMVSHHPGEEFAFDGLTLDDFIKMAENLDTFGSKLADSILDLVHIDSVYDVKYTTWLPVRYNIAGSYMINEHHRFSLLLNGISWDHHFNPAVSVSYCYNLPRILGVLVSYNIFNNQFTNLGLGLSLSAGPFQIFAVSDNVPGLIFYHATNNYSFRLGINIAINRKPETPVTTATP